MGRGGEWEGGSWDGSGKVWSARSHGEAAGVHLFCLHAAKEFRSGQLTGLFAGTEGGTLHAESPNKGVSSSLLGSLPSHVQPQPEVPPYPSADGWPANGSLFRCRGPAPSARLHDACHTRLAKLRPQMVWNTT